MWSHLLLVIALKDEPAAKVPARPRELRLFVNGGYNAFGLSFQEARRFTRFLEDATLDTEYQGGGGPVIELGAIYSVYELPGGGWLGVSGSAELYAGGFDANFRQALPHPFFYRRPREVSGSLAALSYSETAIHFDGVYTRALNARITLDVFGGPSFFVTSTEVLTDLVVQDLYPYDSVTLQRTEVGKVDDSPLGFNLGASVTYRLTPRLGVDFNARFSRGTVRFTPSGGSPIEFSAGGFRASGGIRLLVLPSAPGARGK